MTYSTIVDSIIDNHFRFINLNTKWLFDDTFLALFHIISSVYVGVEGISMFL